MEDNITGKKIEFCFDSLAKDKKRVEEIPLYIDTMQLINLYVQILPQTPKLIQATFGKFILTDLAKALKLIIYSYKYQEARLKELDKLLDIYKEIETYNIILVSSSKFAQNNIARLDVLITQVQKQTQGWLTRTKQAN